MSNAMRERIEQTAAFASAIFEKTGMLPPMWRCITSDGKDFVVGAPSKSKDESVAIMKQIFTEQNVECFVMAVEAWSWSVTANKPDISMEEAMALREKAERREVLHFLCETFDDALTAFREIIREDGNKPRLGPLEFVDNKTTGLGVAGRLTGLLRKETLQ